MDIKLLVAVHKPYQMPKEDIYYPIQVGADGKESFGYLRDDQGQNISRLNPYYSELTGIYWAWQHMKANYLGLVHYRRYFKGNHPGSSPMEKILNRKEIESLLKEYDVIVPVKRNYYIETVYSHYAHTHYKKDLDITRGILNELYPSYIPAFDRNMKKTTAHMFNMFVMKKELFDSYCEFLFSVLFELQERIDVSSYDDFQARVFGRISELLLDVWLDTRNLKYKEVPLVYMEKTPWLKKGGSFLAAKLFNKKYKGSF